MSKKTRKKSPKPSSAKVARAQAKPPAKKPRSKTSRATADKSGKNAVKRPGNAPLETSHTAPSKPLKSPAAAKSAPRVTAASKPPARRPPGGKADASSNSGLAEGASAPAFRLPRDGGDTVSLSDYAGEKLVLFFYPRADTPGCTRESIDFSKLRAAFDQASTDILGVSADPVKAQDAFKKKHELTIGLLSDETHQMLEAYGAWGEKSMYGKSFTGVLRSTVLIGPDGRVAQIWPKVKVEGHAAEVLKAAKAL